MTIRQAESGEENRILNFYHDLILAMKDDPYRPTWTIGVYPLLEDLQAASARNELFLAEEEGRVTGAFILTHAQAEEYQDIPVPMNPCFVLRSIVIHSSSSPKRGRTQFRQ